MVAKVTRKTAAGKKGIAPLKLKKETVRDLDAKRNAGRVKGGQGKRAMATLGLTCGI